MVGKSQDNQGVVNLNSSEPLPSSSEPRVYKYDVFLSFRGQDTRRGIVSQLHDRLQNNRGIKTFMDDKDLQVGESISPTFLKAIEESRFAIVVLSPNYASSPWCLDELAKICECMKDQNRILPLFYTMEPSDVRHRKKSFEEAFKNHERSGRYTSDKVQQWKKALNKVASFSGWDTDNIKTDEELVEKIVDFVCKRIQPFDSEYTLSTEDFQEYGATKKAMDEVMEALRDGDVTAVAVQGMGGVGKTTLVKEAAAQSRKIGLFHHVIMGVVSQRPELTKIQDELAEQLGIEIEEKTESIRAAKLRTEIMGKEKILIILDDVWKRIELAHIGIPSNKELQIRNSKVVLTTRRVDVSSVMRFERKIALDVLSEDDSWSLFVRNLPTSLEFMGFENLARRVAGECRGLPVALKAVARALGDKDVVEWRKAAQRLEKSQYANPSHDEDDENAVKCIRLSYDYLKDEDHKSCFLLCCLFPEDHVINIQDLFRYVVGTRFFQIAETIEEARGTLVSVVKYLKDSSLLLDGGKNGCVKMHDVIRDTAIRIAETERGFSAKAGFSLKVWPHGLDGGYTTISLMRNEISKLPKEELVCPHLQILLLNQNPALDKIPETFIKSLGDFDVSSTSISILPQSFSLLTNLQALYLDNCDELIDISVVGKLKKLEILSLRSCKKYLLGEIGHFTNLRILDIIRSSPITIPCGVISKLHKLEELYMGYCKCESLGFEAEGCGEETDIGFGEIVSLSNLKRLHIGIPHYKCIPNDVEAKPDWNYFSIIIGRPRSFSKLKDWDSRSLFLYGATISMLPDWFINAVANKTEKLEYHDCRESLVMEYDRGRLHGLKHLKVQGELRKCRKELVNTTDRVQKGPLFEKLETLSLKHLFHLEELCVGDLPPGSLVNLKLLRIDDCAVKNVSKFVQRLPSLEEIEFHKVGQLEYVFGCEGSKPKESKLRNVRLFGLYSMKNICSGPSPRVMFQSIKILVIGGCALLKSVFASDVAQCLSQLEDLRVQHCRSLERVIEEVKKEKTTLPKLKKLRLQKLPKLYGASSSTVDIECPSLELVVVLDCPHLPFSILKSSESGNGFSASAASAYFGSTNPVLCCR
ncbi:disease resistance protein At4g27190-like [Argentina anserina]|uniref:disease resistance protein At4g27190-like n=1 Tax=Argentina anserina TaxID=57926 RepID=UPI0021767FD4|nr:disease resistance protein At4g27190-like [Potentilla anserina]